MAVGGQVTGAERGFRAPRLRGLGRAHRHARGQAGPHRQAVKRAVVQQPVRVVDQYLPVASGIAVQVQSSKQAMEPLSGYADDARGGAVEEDGRTDDGTITAQMGVPVAVAEDDEALGADRLALPGPKKPAGRREDAEPRKKVARDQMERELGGRAVEREAAEPGVEAEDVPKDAGLLPVVEERRKREAVAQAGVITGRSGGDNHDAIGGRDRQRPEQVVDEAEGRRVRGRAKGERQDRDQRERGRPDEHPGRIPEIAHRSILSACVLHSPTFPC